MKRAVDTRPLFPLAHAARSAQRRLGAAEGERRTRVLRSLERQLETRHAEILAANAADLEAAHAIGLSAPLLHRLELTAGKLATLRQGVAQLAETPDPVGQVVRHTELDEGLRLRQVRSPLGVLLVIFESRPDAVVQIGSLALRSGNAVILKGGSEAAACNRVLVECLRAALEEQGLPPHAVAGVEGREAVGLLLALDDQIDLVIPRGSGELVRSIQQSTRIPVLGHADGICHLVVDRRASLEMATRLAIDGKCDYPAACNATETLLVHRDFLPRLDRLGAALVERGVEIRADPLARDRIEGAVAASEDDWSTEHGALVLGVRTVDDLDAAITHIHRYGSSHTEAIVTDDPAAAATFLREVDAASVFVNASTRFADGYRYGLGAEVGISTSRIHARGPVGVEGLLTTRWLLEGTGQVAADFGPGKKAFRHRPLPL